MICICLSLAPDVLQLANRAPGAKILIKVPPNVQPSDETKGEAGREERKKRKKRGVEGTLLFFPAPHHLGNNSHSLKTLHAFCVHLEFDCNLRLPFLLWWEIMLQCKATGFLN